jgi:hypothetical protein
MVDMLSPELSSEIEEARVSAVSWAPIVADGVAAAAMPRLLLALEAGIGLSAVVPWSNSGISSTTSHIDAGVYLVIISISTMAFDIGGDLAVCLRIKCIGVQTHEVYFPDVAYGFLA